MKDIRSCRANRTLAPILMNGMRRCRCRRRIPDTEIFRSSAASAIVRSSTAGVGSIDILVKERYSVGKVMPTGVAMVALILHVYESCPYDKGVLHMRTAVKMCRRGKKSHTRPATDSAGHSG
jgi:hypothetical protein